MKKPLIIFSLGIIFLGFPIKCNGNQPIRFMCQSSVMENSCIIRNINSTQPNTEFLYNMERIHLIDFMMLIQNNLFEIPQSLFNIYSKLMEVFIINSGLKQIGLNRFKNAENLMNLNISNNQLSELKANSFYGAVNLRDLDLSKNNLEILSVYSFKGLEMINFLNLSFNKISNIPSGLFTGNNQLERLILSNNQILEYSEIIPSLKSLTISWNKLTTLYVQNEMLIRAGSNQISTIILLSEGDELRELFIENNNLTEIESLINFENLKLISLSNNPIRDLSPLREITSLEELYLRNTNSKYQLGKLSGLSKLKTLDLSYNNLGKFNYYKLNSLKNLKNLYLDGNNLTNIDYKHLSSFIPELEMIGLRNNKWICSFLERMLEFLEIQGVFTIQDDNLPEGVKSVDGIQCKDPVMEKMDFIINKLKGMEDEIMRLKSRK